MPDMKKAEAARKLGLHKLADAYASITESEYDAIAYASAAYEMSDLLAERGEFRMAEEVLAAAGVDPLVNAPLVEDKEEVIVRPDDVDIEDLEDEEDEDEPKGTEDDLVVGDAEEINARMVRPTRSRWKRIYRPRPKTMKKWLCATKPVKGRTRRGQKQVWFSVMKYKIMSTGQIRAMKRIVAYGWSRRPTVIKMKGRRLKWCRGKPSAHMRSKGYRKSSVEKEAQKTASTTPYNLMASLD
jgi:hypothetical protein